MFASPNRDWLFAKQAPKRDPHNAAQVFATRTSSMFDRILHAISTEFETTPALLKGPRRDRALVMARFAAVALVLECCPELSLPSIGRLMGDRDHTTIIHSRRRAGELLQPDKHSAPWRAKYHAARNQVLCLEASRAAE